MDNIVCGRCSVSKITKCIFKKIINIFRDLELEIDLEIPAPNHEKCHSAGQGLLFLNYLKSK